MSAHDVPVGYKQPPRCHQFKKGNVLIRRAAPKATVILRAMCRKNCRSWSG